MSARAAFAQVDASSVTNNILSIVNQLKEIPKHSPTFAVDKFDELEASFAPADLFFSDRDFLYSTSYINESDAYMARFIEWDERVPFRGGNFKRTEAGWALPDMVKGHSKPGDALIVTKAPWMGMYQDKSANIDYWHFTAMVDWEKFTLADRFLTAEDYFSAVNHCMTSLRNTMFLMEKLIVDTFLAAILGVWAYPYGSPLYPFFIEDDTHTPDEDYSKQARGFYKKDGEIRKSMDQLAKEVRARCKNRYAYLTNIGTSEFLGQVLDTTIPKSTERFADRSTREKMLTVVREWYLVKDSNQKYTKVSPSMRRQSLEAFMNAVFRILRRMATADKRNWCGYEAGKDSTNLEGYPMASWYSNIMVVMNSDDFNDVGFLRGSSAAGPITDVSPIYNAMLWFMDKGVYFAPVDFCLPGMGVCLDVNGFRIKEFLNQMYRHFAPKQLVDTIIRHVMKQVVLYGKWPCTVIEPAKGQKYAVPVGWGSDLLPHIVQE